MLQTPSGGHHGGCETKPHARPTDATLECSYHFQAAVITAFHPLPFMDAQRSPGQWWKKNMHGLKR